MIDLSSCYSVTFVCDPWSRYYSSAYNRTKSSMLLAVSSLLSSVFLSMWGMIFVEVLLKVSSSWRFPSAKMNMGYFSADVERAYARHSCKFSFKSVFLCLINYIWKEATKYRLVYYLVNNCTQGFKFFFAFSIESYSTARIHARESHFPGIFTVKGLQAVMRKKKNAHVPGTKLEKVCKQL